uniref:Centriolar coiled-coil protein of 110 kDa n=1 Tax=Elaeophora elaphi TaxID=1147741 RepID=A0A0R3RG49_9BILA
MSAVEAESKCLRDVNKMLPKWFKHTRNIKCGRKIICVDQLYGWRGNDTGYYGSEELEDTPDFLDEVKILPVKNESKNEQLEVLRKEAEERLKKVRETHPNFNILTDRAPTPDFSVTYIETSCSAVNDSVNESQQENVVTATDEVEKTIIDDAASDENSSSNCGEPMENSDVNLTYTIEKNEDNKGLLLLTSENRVKNGEERELILELKLDGTIIIEKSHGTESSVVNSLQECEKEQNNISEFSSDHIDETAKNTCQRREMLNEEVAEHPILQTTDSVNIQHKNEISPQPANQKVFGYPALLQATFDLSRIDKVDVSTDGKNEMLQISSVNLRASRIPHSRPNLMEQMDNSITHVNTSRLSDRTAVSFKTPKQHTRTVVEKTVAKKQSIIDTPLFKKRSIVSKASRGTSTPVEESACYVCPRYDAHHAVLASHATQTGSGTPVSLYNRKTPQNALTPIRRPLPLSSRTSCELSAGKVSTPSRIPVPTCALMAISQYGTPSPLSGGCNRTELECWRTNLMSSITQIPLSRFAFEHLKNGGTPRPTSSTEKKCKEIADKNSLFSTSKTPVAKTGLNCLSYPDISQMLVNNVTRSGPAYRRRANPSKLLSPIGNLRFENSGESSSLSPKCTTPRTKITKEKMNETQHIAIDSHNGDTVDELVEDTVKLVIVGERDIPSEEQEIIFDATTDEYRRQSHQKQQETPVFDTGNYFGQRRILSMLNESNVSVNTPGKEEDSVVNMDPLLSGDSRNPSDISASPVHIIAAKNENKGAAVLCARKIVHCEETEQGLRRSTRNRVAPIRSWLGEKPVYRRDQQGTFELVRVEEAVVKDPLFVKYKTIDMAKALEQQKREQKQHSRARKLRKFSRACRGYAKED